MSESGQSARYSANASCCFVAAVLALSFLLLSTLVVFQTACCSDSAGDLILQRHGGELRVDAHHADSSTIVRATTGAPRESCAASGSMSGRTADLESADLWPSNTTKPLVLFAGPSQGSTLLGRIVERGLELHNPMMDLTGSADQKDRCPEFFNPACYNSGNTSSMLGECFGAQDRWKPGIWKRCRADSWAPIVRHIHKRRAEIIKENFGSASQLLDLHCMGVPVFVAFRKPEHTFPFYDKSVANVMNKWYGGMYSALTGSADQKLRELPAGDRLVQLRDFVVQLDSAKLLTETQKCCIAHFLHFWHLLTAAIEYKIPYLQIEQLMLLDPQDLQETLTSNLCSPLGISGEACSRLASMVVTLREEHHHSHSQIQFEEGVSVAQQIYTYHESEYKEIKCDEPLAVVTTYCSEHVRGCAEVVQTYLA